MKKRNGLELNEHEIWCDFHGCIHDKSEDPYEMGEPECGPEDWRNLWIGALCKKEK